MFVTGEKNTVIAAASVMKCLPMGIYECISRLPLVCLEKVEEILLITGKPVMVFMGGKGSFVTPDGQLMSSKAGCAAVSKKQINEAFRLICDSSVYSYMEDIRQGFITIEGGHRVGVCGSGVRDGGEINTIRDISALNIRIAREIKGCAEHVMPYILKNGSVKNTLIVSPPGCGKTTMLRDIARYIGSGLAGSPLKTAVVDERGEIAAPYQGSAQKDIGCMSVVMDKIPKAECMMLLLRSMAPSVIVTDEIGASEDGAAIKNLINSGVSVIASAHAANREQASKRDDLKELIGGGGGFEVIIELSKKNGPGSIMKVYENAS